MRKLIKKILAPIVRELIKEEKYGKPIKTKEVTL